MQHSLMRSSVRFALLLIFGIALQSGWVIGDPVSVADNAGTAISLKELDRLIESLSEPEGYFDTDNFYLFRQGSWKSYLQNMRQLPWSDNAVLIRTCANSRQRHPAQIPDYYMTTLLQMTSRFFKNESQGRNRTYWDLVTRDYIAP